MKTPTKQKVIKKFNDLLLEFMAIDGVECGFNPKLFLIGKRTTDELCNNLDDFKEVNSIKGQLFLLEELFDIREKDIGR